jgi:hypothetical protein
VVAKEVDWFSYFESIKPVCPWSSAAHLRNLIRIQTWHSQILDLGKFEAIVYTAPNHKPRQLKRITQRLNTQYHQYEFLWSHPKYGGHSTEVPVIIQQDQKRLESIRNRTKSR